MRYLNQETLIDILVKDYPKPELAKIMQHTLNISKATAYKYINNSAVVGYDDMIKLIAATNLSHNKGSNNSTFQPQIELQYQFFEGPQLGVMQYIKTLHNLVTAIRPDDTLLRFSFYEIPIFYYLYFPKLFAFKLFCWSKTVWQNFDKYPNQFSADYILTDEVLGKIQEISNSFNNFRTVEYWTELMADNTIKQINYFREAEYFTNMKDCKEVCKELYELIGLMSHIAKTGHKYLVDKKTLGGATEIYQNEIYFTNNIVILESPIYNLVFSAFDNPNFLITKDERMVLRCKNWLKDLQEHCTSLTHTNEIKRKDFFGSMLNRVEQMGFEF